MRTHRVFLQPTSFDEEEQWEKEREQWSKRDLSDKEYVYLWADGIYFNVRLNDDRPCVLVIVGSLPDGTKELVTISDGERESKLSWKNVLRDLKLVSGKFSDRFLFAWRVSREWEVLRPVSLCLACLSDCVIERSSPWIVQCSDRSVRWSVS